jgi:hypothetical protein
VALLTVRFIYSIHMNVPLGVYQIQKEKSHPVRKISTVRWLPVSVLVSCS